VQFSLMSCILTLAGKDLDVDDFIKKSKLRPYKVSYKGQPRLKTKPEGEKLTYSLLSVETSKADFSDLQKQIKDTIRYLERNKEKLTHISLTNKVQHVTLNFGIDLKVNRKNILTQSELLPSKLLKLAGDLGIDIELSLFPIDLHEILERKTKKRR
jgi:hypothetical protein